MKKNQLKLKFYPGFNCSFLKSCSTLALIFACISGFAQSWVPVGGADFTSGSCQYNSLTIDHSGNLFFVYEDGVLGGGGAGKASVMKYDGTSWSFVGSERFSAGDATYTSIALNNSGTPYVAYVDNATASAGATVMKYNGTSWVNVGTPGFSAGEVNYTTLALDTAGTPYVAYEDYTCAQKGTVMKFNGTTWVNVGASCFTPGQANFVTMAVWGVTPYVFYSDVVNGSKASVMKYNGTSWVNVGVAGFSTGAITATSMSINAGGTPYVAFPDFTLNGKLVVMKFNGTSWVNVGTPGFSDTAVGFTSLAIDPGGTPYVAFEDMGTLKMTVMKFNGIAWVNAGSPSFTPGTTQWISMAISASGKPYVAYQDWVNSNKATVVTAGGWLGETDPVNIHSGSISVFPNPAHGSFNILVKASGNDDAQITITNILGQRVKEITLPTNIETKLLLNEPAGVYFITAISNKERVTSKIVIE